jgi:hypothetical protein
VAGRKIAFLLAVLSAVVLGRLPSARAQSAPNDSEVETLIQGVLATDYSQGKFTEALEKLEIGKIGCEGDSCSKKVRAKLFVAIGMAQTRAGKADEAREAFASALRDDPNAAIDPKYDAPDVRQAIESARQQRLAQKTGCRASFKDRDRPAGWQSSEAYHCYQQAQKLQREREFKACADDARVGLEAEDQPALRMLLAQCLEAGQSWNDAIAEYDNASGSAQRRGMFSLGRRAAGRAGFLRARMPALFIRGPSDAEKLQVQLDGTTLPVDVLDTEIPIDPGPHKILAQGVSTAPKTRGQTLTFEQEVTAEPGRTTTVAIQLAPGTPKFLTPEEVNCFLAAKTREEINACIAARMRKRGDPTYRVASELSGYHDDMNVDVLTPSIAGSVEHTTDGWGLGASFLVDVVTAASVDIVATASPPWREVRFVPALNGHKRFDDLDVGLNGSLSHEPDYISAAVGLRAALDLVDKTVTPSLGYEFSYDINGRVDTPFDVFAREITRHAISAGVGLVLTKATFGSVGLTAVFEDGDSSKPYRHVPMFRPEIADAIRLGEPAENVNLVREPERPLEQLPTNRQRFAGAAAVAHRFSEATLRVSQRLYFDTWGLFATTTDARFLYDVLKELRVGPHVRFHAQTGANFYERAYVVQRTTTSVLIPPLRTGDRELGPLYAITGGGSVRYDFGEQRYGVGFGGDVIYTRFLDHLFVINRFGFFGALTFDAEFD